MTTLTTHFLKNSRIGSGTVAKEVKYDEKCQTIHLELGTQRKMPREVICLTKSDIWLFVALTQLYKKIPQCGFNNSIGNIHNMCFWNTNQWIKKSDTMPSTDRWFRGCENQGFINCLRSQPAWGCEYLNILRMWISENYKLLEISTCLRCPMVRPRCYKEGKQHLERTRLQKYYLKIIEIIRLL